MPKASSMGTDNHLSFLFKSGPGMAKTCAAASFAVDGPVHISYFDKRKPVELEKYFKHIVKRPELLDNITYESYGSQNINEYLNQIIEWGVRGCKYTTVITDSLTNLTSSAVNWSLGFKDPRTPDDKKTVSIPDWDEYKVETSLVVQALDILMTLP